MTQPALSSLENERATLGVIRANRLAKALGIRASLLLYPDGEPVSRASTPRAKPRSAGSPTILENVARSDWGWWSREDPRMHLQTVGAGEREGSKKRKVWLEICGKRVVQPSAGMEKRIQGAELKELRSYVAKNRLTIEARWISFMLENHWLRASLSGRRVTVTAYPGTHNEFKRTIDLHLRFPGAYPDWDATPPIVDFDRHGMLRVGDANLTPNHRGSVPLEGILFTD